MVFWVVTILNMCILIPAVTGLVRYSKINPNYYPFIYCIWAGLMVEIVSNIFVLNGYSNAVISNVYVLIESLMLLWLFTRWKLFEIRKILLSSIIVIFVVMWILENFVFSKITSFCSYFRILYSFVIVIMSIIIVNRLVVSERKNLLKNSTFLFCIAFIFYYTLQIMVEAFWIYGVDNDNFSRNVYYISIVTNFITNLLFTVAIIWIPTRQRFTLPSS